MGAPQADPKGTHTGLYTTLGVGCEATPVAIKKAFRRKSIQSHPDKGGDSSTYQKITHAYGVLGDTFKRAVYDDYGEEGLESEMMQAVVRRRMRKQLEPVNVHIKLNLEDCLEPHSKKVSFRRITIKNGDMTTKDVEVHVDLPRGLTNGQVVKIEEEGNFIENSKTDLLCTIELKEHPTFKVQGFELLIEQDISFVSALLGCVCTVPTLNDPEYQVLVPPLSVFRDPVRTVDDKGLPVRDTGIMGSLHIKFNVDFDSMEDVTISKELGILLRDELRSHDNEHVGGTIPVNIMDTIHKTKTYDSDEVKKRMELARDLDGHRRQEQRPMMPGGIPFPMPMDGNGVECATQ